MTRRRSASVSTSRPSVFAICYWRTGDAATAEDVTSVVFLEAWKRATWWSSNSARATLVARSSEPRVAQRNSFAASLQQALKRLDGHRTRQAMTGDRPIDAETSLNLVNEVIRDLTEQEREMCCWCSGVVSLRSHGGGARSSGGKVRSRVSRTRRKLQLRLGGDRVGKEAS